MRWVGGTKRPVLVHVYELKNVHVEVGTYIVLVVVLPHKVGKKDFFSQNLHHNKYPLKHFIVGKPKPNQSFIWSIGTF